MARRILGSILGQADRGDVLESLDELFRIRSQRAGSFHAAIWYWRQVLGFLLRWRGARRSTGHHGGEAKGRRRLASLRVAAGQDLVGAVGQLRRNKRFAASAIVIFAVGIGVNVAMYSTAFSMLVEPLPFVDPSELVIGRVTREGARSGMGFISVPDFLDYRERTTAFESLAALMPFSQHSTLTGAGEPERIAGAVVSTNLFSTLGVDPQLGRGFTEEDGRPGGPNVVLISDGLWKSGFGEAPDVVGRALIIDSVPFTVIGAMPAGFRFLTGADFWRPMRPDRDAAGRRDRHNWFAIGRLRSGVAVRNAQAEIDTVSAQLADEYPDTNSGKGMVIASLQSELVADYRNRLFLLSAAVGVVLLIACGNLTGMLLARAPERRTELAVRAALGASRARLVGQMLCEAVVLAGAGGAVGIATAVWMQQTILNYLQVDLPGVNGGHLSWPMLGLTLIFSLVAGLAAGVYPALAAARGTGAEGLKEGAWTSVGGGTRFRGRLVVGQVAISVVLLVGSGLLLRSFASVRATDPGFDAERLLTAEIELPSAEYADPALRAQFWSALLQGLERIPGVVSAAAINSLPIRGTPSGFGASSSENPDQFVGVLLRSALPGYFDALRIPLLRGRGLGESVSPEGPRIVIVSRTAARTFFADEDPLGRRLRIDIFGNLVEAEVVGVVGDVRMEGLEAEPAAALYLPYAQLPNTTMQIALRVVGEPAEVVPALRDVVRRLDPNLPVADILTMEEVLSDSVSERRTIALSLTLFAALPLLLAAFGLYAVLAHYVNHRLKELGIRMALGAGGAAIGRMILWRGARLIGAGLLLGFPAAVGSARLIRHLLFHTAPTDIPTLAGVALFVGGVAVVACVLPTWRAVRMDPAAAFRSH
jgi:predicted permease